MCPEGANHLVEENPPGELSIDAVAAWPLAVAGDTRHRRANSDISYERENRLPGQKF